MGTDGMSLVAFLQDEEASLNGLKRRNFRESFSMRMRSMAQLGKVMQENAHEAIALLSQLDQGGYSFNSAQII
jgi:hypothetical protein